MDGVRVCDTIENRSHHLAEGRYYVAMSRCQCTGKCLPLVVSMYEGGFCRDCSRCRFIRRMNENTAYSYIDKMYQVIAQGMEEGVPEPEYLRQALQVERALPPHPEREPMPFCPHLRAGNGVAGLTDGSIIVGTAVRDVPGMVTGSNEVFWALRKHIYISISRGHSVALNITERFV